MENNIEAGARMINYYGLFDEYDYASDLSWDTTPTPKHLRGGKRVSVRDSKTNPKINRNEPCPCGSGKKYKKCCIDKVIDNGETEEGENAE